MTLGEFLRCWRAPRQRVLPGGSADEWRRDKLSEALP
jgi:hypothetical protein